MNTVASNTPTEILNKNSRILFGIFFLINNGITNIIETSDTIITLTIGYMTFIRILYNEYTYKTY